MNKLLGMLGLKIDIGWSPENWQKMIRSVLQDLAPLLLVVIPVYLIPYLNAHPQWAWGAGAVYLLTQFVAWLRLYYTSAVPPNGK